MRIQRTVLVAVAVALALLGVSGCANDPGVVEPPETGESSSSVEPTGTGGASDDIDVLVYFSRGESIGVVRRSVAHTQATAAAAMTALLGGPTAEEKAWGFGTEIPAGTTLNSVSVTDGVATVDLGPEFDSGGGSLSMQLRAAEVVYTLTQFPTVDTVRFELDGVVLEALGGEGLILSPPTDRDAYENVTPAILVESPVPGDIVASPVRIMGISNTFEAAFSAEVTAADGTVLGHVDSTATSGTGTRGTFDASLPFKDADPGAQGTVEVYQVSAKDGSRIDVYRVPVTFD